MKFADLEKSAAEAEARAAAAEERARVAEEAAAKHVEAGVVAVLKASDLEREASATMERAEKMHFSAQSLERMLRQDLWRETFLACLSEWSKRVGAPEDAVAKAAEAAHAAAMLVPPVHPPPPASGMLAMYPTALATALLMRELVCEQVYRGRARWDAEHPCRALGLRDITPEEVLPFAKVGMLTWTNEERRKNAAFVLDSIVEAREKTRDLDSEQAALDAWDSATK